MDKEISNNIVDTIDKIGEKIEEIDNIPDRQEHNQILDNYKNEILSLMMHAGGSDAK